MLLEPLRLPFDVTLRLPGSKSHANRAIVAACLARGRTLLRDATPCDDVRALVENLRRLGFRLEWFDEDDGVLHVEGGLPAAPPPTQPVELDCGLGGTTLRFLVAVASLVPGEWIVTGSARMRERPIGALVDALRGLGVDAVATDGRPPVRVRGGLRRGGTVALDASRSSQFLSALLLIGAVLDDGLCVGLTGSLASAPYVDLTRHVLAGFGVEVAVDGGVYRVPGTGLRTVGDIAIEGDWSAAGAWISLAEITRSRFVATNLDAASAQADRLLPVQLALLRRPGEVELDVGDTPDQTMNLAVVAALRDGTTRIRGAATLRDKECDRLAVTASELRKAGVDVEETEDGLVLRGPASLGPARLSCHGDHRMAMAFALLGAVAPGIEIDDTACLSKSYPGFLGHLRSAHHSARCIAVVGMRAAGKSTLARALAAELGLEFVDVDEEFERQRGPIAAFVENSGWEAFRAIESALLANLLGHGRVVAVGGGALERPGNVDLVRGRALVVWVREPAEVLVERIASADRPPLTDLPLADEVREVLARREPTYASVADFTLAPGTTVDARVRATAAWLRAPLRRGAAAGTPGVPGTR